ncbi:MAG TPA: hypothetical protein DCW68_01055 [Rhodospirillaceae bacterium]|nr:MAG: hypothetical protein A2018_00560 [Alphaproteobacteria bacterium GWF2_58_20]HAU28687.1 hypothetical protein [Rhodospirillaceae bacterium]
MKGWAAAMKIRFWAFLCFALPAAMFAPAPSMADVSNEFTEQYNEYWPWAYFANPLDGPVFLITSPDMDDSMINDLGLVPVVTTTLSEFGAQTPVVERVPGTHYYMLKVPYSLDERPLVGKQLFTVNLGITNPNITHENPDSTLQLSLGTGIRNQWGVQKNSNKLICDTASRKDTDSIFAEWHSKFVLHGLKPLAAGAGESCASVDNFSETVMVVPPNVDYMLKSFQINRVYMPSVPPPATVSCTVDFNGQSHAITATLDHAPAPSSCLDDCNGFSGYLHACLDDCGPGYPLSCRQDCPVCNVFHTHPACELRDYVPLCMSDCKPEIASYSGNPNLLLEGVRSIYLPLQSKPVVITCNDVGHYKWQLGDDIKMAQFDIVPYSIANPDDPVYESPCGAHCWGVVNNLFYPIWFYDGDCTGYCIWNQSSGGDKVFCDYVYGGYDSCAYAKYYATHTPLVPAGVNPPFFPD